MRRLALYILQATLLVAAVTVAALSSRASDWEPAGLVVVLAAVALLSDALTIETRGQRLSGCFLALVLAMAFLGPAPAMVVAILTIVVDAVRSHPPAWGVLNNLSTYAAFPVVGGLLARGAVDLGVHPDEIAYGFVVLGVYVVAIVMNFALTAIGISVVTGRTLRSQLREILVPILPSEAAAATLVLAFAIAYVTAGVVALVVLGVALIAFQYLTRALLLSQERAEQLEARTTELASLQVGVLASLVQTLSLRDKMTARHSAAVARYSRAIAEAAGLSSEEQDLVHTAGLLHDVGKFIFPDRILFADRRLSDADWEIVKRHPAQGARVVQRVAGYGPVAEIILCHHERIDGGGYPRGLEGDQIPVLSRIISVADTYDVMTARDSYRNPVSHVDAVAEMRRVSGTQLDAALVETFIELLERANVGFQHTTDADFEAELAFDQRVRAFVPAP